MKNVLFSLTILFVFGDASAQLLRFKKSNRRPTYQSYGMVGIGGGTASYYGEMSPVEETTGTFFKLMRWNVSASYTHQFSDRLAAKTSFTVLRLEGNDYNFIDEPSRAILFLRNLHFRNTLKELNVMGQYYIFGQGKNFTQRTRLAPYVSVGLAVFAHNPRAKSPLTEGSQWVDLQPLRTEGQGLTGYSTKPYSLVQLAVPLGLGVRYKLSERLDLSVELIYRRTFTDYLDDVGDKYASPADLENQVSSLARQMGNRTLEPINARNGQDRTQRALEIMVNNFGYSPNQDPFGQPIPGLSTQIDQRGNPKRLDHYMLTCFQVHYVLVKGIKCPPIR
jgi:hypothetical protein